MSRIDALAARLGRGNTSSLSKRPGRRSAASKASTLFVAPATHPFAQSDALIFRSYNQSHELPDIPWTTDAVVCRCTADTLHLSIIQIWELQVVARFISVCAKCQRSLVGLLLRACCCLNMQTFPCMRQ